MYIVKTQGNKVSFLKRDFINDTNEVSLKKKKFIKRGNTYFEELIKTHEEERKELVALNITLHELNLRASPLVDTKHECVKQLLIDRKQSSREDVLRKKDIIKDIWIDFEDFKRLID